MLIAIVGGPDEGRISEVEDEAIVLGRHGTLQLADRKVSKRHAQLRCDGGTWYIEDMGSTNGTYVNGARVDRPRRVSENDKLELGRTVMVISKLAPEPRAVQQPLPTSLSAPSPSTAPSPSPAPSALPSSSPTTPFDEPPSAEPAVPAEPSLSSKDVTSPVNETKDNAQRATQPSSSQPPPVPPSDALARAQGDADPLAAWSITFAEGRAQERTITASASPDESILSIRPLVHQEPPSGPPWRRAFPYVVLTLVLIAIVANIALMILFRRDARREVQDLRSALEQRDQTTAELIVQEVRDELRSPSPQQAQAMQELREGLSAKQEMFNEKLLDDLAERDAKLVHEAATGAADHERHDASESQAAVARELAQLREAIADLRRSSPSIAAPTSAEAVSAERSSRVDTNVSEGAAQPTATVKAHIDQTFLIDASGDLARGIPTAAAEVRRALREKPPHGAARVLLLYQDRLMELQPATLNSPEGAETIDHGPADLSKALSAALADHPSSFHLLSEAAGDVSETLRIIGQADAGGTTINVTQFFSRNNREELKSLARDHHGTYTFVPTAN